MLDGRTRIRRRRRIRMRKNQRFMRISRNRRGDDGRIRWSRRRSRRRNSIRKRVKIRGG